MADIATEEDDLKMGISQSRKVRFIHFLLPLHKSNLSNASNKNINKIISSKDNDTVKNKIKKTIETP